jgi:arylsulfatase A-like enzyme
MRNRSDLLDQSGTVQRLLQRGGYRTGFFGKYLNGWPLDVDPPHFDEWAIFRNSSPAGYLNGEWNVDGRLRTITRYSTGYIARRGIDFIREAEHDRAPWILFLSTAAPHKPYDPEPKYANAPVGSYRVEGFEKELSDKARFVKGRATSRAAGRAIRAKQLRTLMSVDDMVAQIRQQLRDSREARNTLAFFLSDNGYMWGQHRMVGKMTPYTASTHIPLLMSWKGHVERGAEDDRLAANIDVPVTILDATRTKRTPAMDGISLLGPARDELLLEFWEAYGRPTWFSLRTGVSQYIEYYEDGGTTPSFREYYDLTTDPNQQNNLLADDDPANDPDVEQLHGRLERAKACPPGNCP